ncbi:MAG TPA: excinuclease ABC subunit UvrC [Longimicrobiaceae bacterium]|jgi:excinuclease ABC subunit C|nr:excinuclease ABC subunit UvrC [Longimicrobiaceae bacterium]
MPETAVLESKLRHLATRPGVYLMKDAEGEIIYVGKAKSLRPRVRSYFNSGRDHSLKTREMVRRVADVDTIVVDTEAEALILENNLIKEYRPRFNINLRDDKTYPYIKVTADLFPRIYVTRTLTKDGARYFGPYTDVRRMRMALELVKKLYTVRSCHYDLPREKPARPCLDFHIGRCKAPCVDLQTEDDYRQMVDEIRDILGGHTRRAAARLREQMAAAAAAMDFERAGALRDTLRELEALESKQRVVDLSGADRDVVGMARDGAEACGIVLQIREGKLLGREAQFLTNLADETDEAVLSAFVTRLYTERALRDSDSVPGEVFLPSDFEDRELLERLLREQTGRAVRTHVPQRGEKVQLVELAAQNARHLLEERRLSSMSAGTRAPDALYELQEVLELGGVPRTILCFDISHTQGTEVVASGVFFEDGEPNKGEYKKFKIRGEWGNDDFASMHEVVTRWFRRRLDEGKPLPDLVVIDGGKGQLGAARKALDELDLGQQAIISLAKKDEEVFVPGRPDSIRMLRRSPALRLLQRIRDEAHRFAITYNRKLRTKRTVRSELSTIPGVGAARQRALLGRFGSMRAVGQASEAEIAAIPGFGPAMARAVLRHLRGEEPQAEA